MEYIDLYKLISKTSHVNIEKIQHTSRLEKDLGIDGDDAINFLTEYSNKFKVNIDNLECDKYFTSEYPVVLFYLSKIFPKLGSKTDELTVHDLIIGIENHRLDDAIIKRDRELLNRKWNTIDKAKKTTSVSVGEFGVVSYTVVNSVNTYSGGSVQSVSLGGGLGMGFPISIMHGTIPTHHIPLLK